MDRHGHERIRVMEGPRERWEDARHAWSAEVPEPESSPYERQGEKPELVVGLEEVREMIGDPETVLVDVRSKEEFSGERFWPSGASEGAGRPGRLPGAVHVPVELAREQDGSLADGEALRRACEERGVEPGRRVVVYCTIGNRASQVGFALKHQLGYPDVPSTTARGLSGGARRRRRSRPERPPRSRRRLLAADQARLAAIRMANQQAVDSSFSLSRPSRANGCVRSVKPAGRLAVAFRYRRTHRGSCRSFRPCSGGASVFRHTSKGGEYADPLAPARYRADSIRP